MEICKKSNLLKGGASQRGNGQRNRENGRCGGVCIPLLHRGRKAGRRVQFAPSASLCSASFDGRKGRTRLTSPPSVPQRYNTLDFLRKSCAMPPARSIEFSGDSAGGAGPLFVPAGCGSNRMPAGDGRPISASPLSTHLAAAHASRSLGSSSSSRPSSPKDLSRMAGSMYTSPRLMVT